MIKEELVDLITRILAWGLIAAAIAIIALRCFGIIPSPEMVSLESLIGLGILVELGRLETKMSLLWTDFRARKKI